MTHIVSAKSLSAPATAWLGPRPSGRRTVMSEEEAFLYNLFHTDICQFRTLLALHGYRYTINPHSNPTHRGTGPASAGACPMCRNCGLPIPLQLSRDHGGGLAKTCAFKEFRFEPPFVAARRREKGGGGGGGGGGGVGGGRKKLLPPIPENMLPRRHNSLDEELSDSLLTGAPTTTHASLSISPAFITEKPDERSLSVEAPPGKSPQPGLYNAAAREFTFPESSAHNKRKSLLPCQPSVVPAMTPRVRDMPLQAKIEKLAKQKRKERAKRTSDRRYERKLHHLLDPPAANTHMAFRSRREPEVPNSFNLREQKQLPFKQMSRSSPDDHAGGEKSKLPPRLYTKIVDSIYSYTKGGIHGGGGGNSRHGSYERLMVTPVTTKDDMKDDVHSSRQISVLPPIV